MCVRSGVSKQVDRCTGWAIVVRLVTVGQQEKAGERMPARSCRAGLRPVNDGN